MTAVWYCEKCHRPKQSAGHWMQSDDAGHSAHVCDECAHPTWTATAAFPLPRITLEKTRSGESRVFGRVLPHQGC